MVQKTSKNVSTTESEYLKNYFINESRKRVLQTRVLGMVL